MRALIAGLFALLTLTPASAALRPPDTESTAAATNWINAYRAHPDPNNVPAVMRALSRLGAFNDPDQSGAYVGFLAGVLAANPRTGRGADRAEPADARPRQLGRGARHRLFRPARTGANCCVISPAACRIASR